MLPFQGSQDANTTEAGVAEDVKKKYDKNVTDEEFFKHLFKDDSSLCGQTCAWLASGQGKELRGLFLGNYSYLLAFKMYKG